MSQAMMLVVGLGNPGREYVESRHNAGFLVVGELARSAGASFVSKFKGQMARADIGGRPTVLLQPLTYMNLSGESVGPCARFFGIEPPAVVVVHDELDLAFGDVRVKRGGGHAGHNGLRSIMQVYAKDGDFSRVRVGIGRPRFGTPTAWVLSPFSPEERAELPDVVSRAADAVEAILRGGVGDAMNAFNRRRRTDPLDSNGEGQGPDGPDARKAPGVENG